MGVSLAGALLSAWYRANSESGSDGHDHHWDVPETAAPCYAKFLLEFEDNGLFQTQNSCNHLSFYSLTTGALKDRIPCPGIGLFLGVYEEPF